MKTAPAKSLVLTNKLISETITNEKEYHSELACAYRIKATLLATQSIDSVDIYRIKSLEIAEKHKDWDQYIQTQGNIANSYTKYGKFEKGDSLFQLIFSHPHYDHNPKFEMVLLLQHSRLFDKWGKDDEMIATLNKAIELANKEDIHNYDSVIYNILSTSYGENEEFEKSIEYSRKNIEHLDKSDYRVFISYNNISNCFLQLNQLDSARHYLMKVINGKPKKSSLIHTYQSLADLYQQEEDYDEAMIYAKKCHKLAEEFDRWTSKCQCKFFEATILYKTDKPKTAKAILSEIDGCTEKMSKLYRTQYEEIAFANELTLLGKENLASEWHKIIERKDSLRNGIASKNLRVLETKYQTQKKEAENQLLKKDNALAEAKIASQRTIIGGAGAVLLSLGLLLWNMISRARERKNNIAALTEKNEAIHALNNEIAHRTKNHLALATALLSKDRSSSDDPAVKASLADNENRLRTLTLVNQKLNQASASKELNLKDYLQELCDDLMFGLEKTRTSALSLNCPDLSLDSEKVLRLGLITNELITNSFKHAHTSAQALNIDIEIAKQGAESILYSYSDNGEAQELTPSLDSKGIGLIDNLWLQMHGEYQQSFSPHYKLNGTLAISS